MSENILALAKFYFQGPTNILDKTCPWASGTQKALARKDELVVQSKLVVCELFVGKLGMKVTKQSLKQFKMAIETEKRRWDKTHHMSTR